MKILVVKIAGKKENLLTIDPFLKDLDRTRRDDLRVSQWKTDIK